MLHPYRTFEGYMRRFFSNFGTHILNSTLECPCIMKHTLVLGSDFREFRAGWRFAVQISVFYLLIRGIMHATIHMTQLPFCKKVVHVDGSDC